VSLSPDARLSDHFRVRELFPDLPPPDRLELYLARQLCHNVLEPLREIADEPLLVTDGRRTWRRHLNLKDRRLKPSPTSDHAYGAGFVEGFLEDRTRKWPAAWFFGTGAADVVPARTLRWTMRQYREAERRLVDEPEEPLVGQLIYYPKRGHLHVSNPRHLILSAQAIRELGLPAKRGPAYVSPD
jgi:hypothetical protein